MNDDQLYLQSPSPSDAPPILAALAAQIRFEPDVFAFLGKNPHALEAFASMNALFTATNLTAIEREVVQTAANVIGTVRADRKIENHKLEALRRFSLALIDTAGRDTNAELAAFLKAGYRKDQVLDVILGISIKMFSNLAGGKSAIPLDDAFAPFEWPHANRQRDAA